MYNEIKNVFLLDCLGEEKNSTTKKKKKSKVGNSGWFHNLGDKI